MSDKSKGTAYEKRVRGWLEARGYLVEQAQRSAVWIPDGRGGRRPISLRVDLFGAFDLVGIHTERRTRWVQVTTVASRSAHRVKVEGAVAGHYPGLFHEMELWSWGKWAERGYGFIVDRLRGAGVWEHGVDFIPSKDAPEKPAAA